MSDAVQVAIITQLGLIILGILTNIFQRQRDKNKNEKHHVDNIVRLDTMVNEIAELKKELPDGGLASWISTVEANSKIIKEQTEATNVLSTIVTDLKATVLRHDSLITELMAGGTA